MIDKLFSKTTRITYPLFVKGAAENIPHNKRKTMMDAEFFDKAQPSVKHLKIKDQYVANMQSHSESYRINRQ